MHWLIDLLDSSSVFEQFLDIFEGSFGGREQFRSGIHEPKGRLDSTQRPSEAEHGRTRLIPRFRIRLGVVLEILKFKIIFRLSKKFRATNCPKHECAVTFFPPSPHRQTISSDSCRLSLLLIALQLFSFLHTPPFKLEEIESFFCSENLILKRHRLFITYDGVYDGVYPGVYHGVYAGVHHDEYDGVYHRDSSSWRGRPIVRCGVFYLFSLKSIDCSTIIRKMGVIVITEEEVEVFVFRK